MCKRMLKKILLTVLVLALLVGVVLGVRRLNATRTGQVNLYSQETDIIPNEALTVLEGSGLQLAAENDQLALYVNFDDGNIEVLRKANGYVWRSCPTEEEMALEKSNKLWTNNLQAPIMFTYVQQNDAANTKYTNTLTEEAKVTVYRLADGVRVYFELGVHEVTLAYEARLKGGTLEVSMPSYLISDPGEVYKTSKSGKVSLDKDKSCIIAEIYLFPNLGATRSDTNVAGALLVPDGSGALIDFQSRKFVNSQYIAPIYGSDLALHNGFDSTVRAEMSKPKVAFPVYGVIREGNTLLAIVDEGETQTDIVASRAGVQTGFNTVSARFTYRMRYKVITNSTTGDGYLNYTSFAVTEPRKIIYNFGTGDYVDMAAQYRSYLMEKNRLTRVDGSASALQLHVVGGDIESGMLGDTFIAMTTFQQAEDILRWFSEQGVSDMDVAYTGWSKRGESVEYPNRFPVANALGGQDGLTKLTEAAKELHADVYLLDNYINMNTTFGLSLGKNTVYNIQNNPLYSGAFANSGYMASSYAANLAQYRAMGIAGLQEQGVGKVLMTDYAKSAPMSRSDVRDAQRTLLEQMVQDFDSVRLTSANAYALMNDAVLTQLPESSWLTMLDEHVPFYTIALHGLVEYLDGDYMDFYEQRSQLLEAVAKGSSVSFTLTWENTEKLAMADTAAYYSTTFDLWKDDVLTIWQELQPYLDATRGQFITGYEQLADGVTLTTYENGVEVLVNNRDSSYFWHDTEVAPRSFQMKGV